MSSVTIIYGSSTGSTQLVAKTLAKRFNAKCVNICDATKEDFQAPLLILGTSTWGYGELQEDWQTGLTKLQAADLSGSHVALFGLGDQNSFPDTYVDGMGLLYQEVEGRTAGIVGRTSCTGYQHTRSLAESEGMFCGLALDDMCEHEKTGPRIDAWVLQLQKETA